MLSNINNPYEKKIKDGFISTVIVKALQNKNILKKSLWIIKIINMSNKRVLITGATGFIGSHLTELFVKNGYKVTAFDRYNPDYNLGHLSTSIYKKEVEFIFGDIRDFDSVYKAAKEKYHLHLAALIGIPYSYYSPLAYIKTNIEGTYNVLEASKNLNTDQTVVTSTSETYGSALKIPMDEKHRPIGQSPYAASKIAADQLAISYCDL